MPTAPSPALPRALVAARGGSVGTTVRVCGGAEPGPPGGPARRLRDHTGRVRLVERPPGTGGAIVPESAIEVVGHVVAEADAEAGAGREGAVADLRGL